MSNATAAAHNSTVAIVDRIDAAATVMDTPCGAGLMRWRSWGDGAPLVLLHGGFGSWLHWIRNIEPLSQQHRVIACDLPGLGESDLPPDTGSPAAIGAVVASGLRQILGNQTFDIAAFSFGGLIAGEVARTLGAQVQTLVLVGASGMQLNRPPMELMRRNEGMSEADRAAAYVHNTMTLMLHDRASLDALALHVQKTNDANARLRSRKMSLGDSLRLALPLIEARIAGIWGEFDATAIGYMDERPELLRSVQPGAPFVVIEGAGHWVQYEASDAFNAALNDIVDTLSNRTR